MQNNGVRISRELRDIIHGYIMSEGSISKDSRLKVEQGIHQEKFVKWLYERLKPLCTEKGPIKTPKPDKRWRPAGKMNYSIRFYTRPLLHEFNSMWYEENPSANGPKEKNIRFKRLPKSIPEFFSSTFVTLWFAGAGTKETGSWALPALQAGGYPARPGRARATRASCCPHTRRPRRARAARAAKIEVTAFNPEERQLLQGLFKSKFDIATKINKAGLSKSGKQQWVLRIPANEYDKFRHIITKMDLIPALFPHKLHKK